MIRERVSMKGFLLPMLVHVSALLAIGNICRNACHYCGLRSPNTGLKRYRLSLDEARAAFEAIKALGLGRVFLISGEDGGRTMAELSAIVAAASAAGLEPWAAFGEYGHDDYKSLRDAGLSGYALKFETSDPTLYARIRPGHELRDRLASMEAVRESGLRLATGSIVGLAGDDRSVLERDRALTVAWDPFWVPVVPYMPVPGTPLASSCPPGDVATTLAEIRVLRAALPEAMITANQPSESDRRFTSTEGRRAAMAAGADLLFVDATPLASRGDFSVVAERSLPDLGIIESLARESGAELERG